MILVCSLMQLDANQSSSLTVCTGVFINEIQEKIRQKLTLEKKEPKKPTKFEWDPVIVVPAFHRGTCLER